MVHLLRFKKDYKNLNVVEVDKKRLQENFSFFKKYSPRTAIFPVLKSNAYGHGLIEVAKIIDNFSCPYICVDSLYEAYTLHKICKTPILIMGYTNPQNYMVKKLPFTFVVDDIATLAVLNTYQKGAKIHIKIDTGMHRLGIRLENIPSFIEQLSAFGNIRIEGIMSHFANADSNEEDFMQEQLTVFKQAIQLFKLANISFLYRHISATAGTLRLQDPYFNASRIGIGLYGISPITSFQRKLKPVMRLISHIIHIGYIKKGESVGYDRTFIAPNDMCIGVISLGYSEGLDRRLSNIGFVTWKGRNCSIIGRISMNMATIDLQNAPSANVGDKVCIYDNKINAKNSLIASSNLARTIPYDLMVKINPSIKRVVIEN